MAKKSTSKVVKKSTRSAAAAKTKTPIEETAPENSNAGDKKFACSYCNQAFARKYDMEKHSRKHTGDKPYKCGICGKQFVSLIDFNDSLLVTLQK